MGPRLVEENESGEKADRGGVETKKVENFQKKMRTEGLEPSHLAVQAPKTCVSAIPPRPRVRRTDFQSVIKTIIFS
jgi:hypothetical protein